MNKGWITLLAITLIITLYFLIRAGSGIWEYIHLRERSKAAIEEWSVIELGSSKFNVQATYSYEVNKNLYKGTTQFKRPIFLNRYAAEAEIKEWSGFDWSVWYDPHHPQESHLQRIFPFKDFFYSLVCLAVLVYFFILKRAPTQ